MSEQVYSEISPNVDSSVEEFETIFFEDDGGCQTRRVQSPIFSTFSTPSPAPLQREHSVSSSSLFLFTTPTPEPDENKTPPLPVVNPIKSIIKKRKLCFSSPDPPRKRVNFRFDVSKIKYVDEIDKKYSMYDDYNSLL